MSPLVASPNRGYADWQRVNNYDTDLVWNDVSPGNNATRTSPVIDCSRFAYCAGQIGPTVGQVTAVFVWYTDGTLATAVGSRAIIMDNHVTGGWVFRIPNVGPFVQIRVQAIGGAAFTCTSHVFLSNRYSPTEFIVSNSYLFDLQAIFIAAATNQTQWNASAFAGPVQFHLTSNTGNVAFQLQALNTSGVLDQRSPVITPAANIFSTITWLVPADAWAIIANNTGANGNYYIIGQHTTTGAT
jgi:hypothetical protein